MKRTLRAILFLLSMDQAFAADKASGEELKKGAQQKTGSSTTPPSLSRLSKPVDVVNKKPSGTLSSEERKKLEAEKLRHARSKTLPVFNFPLPQAHTYKPAPPAPVKYIKAPERNNDDIFLLCKLVEGHIALHKPFGHDEAEVVQQEFQQKTRIKPSLEEIYKTASEIARTRAEIAQRDGAHEWLQNFTKRAAECDEHAKKAAAIK